MSATPKPSPPVLPPPERHVPVAVPAEPKKPSSARFWALAALIAAGAWTAYHFLSKPASQGPAAQTAAIRTAKVTTGSIRRVLRLTGTTSAKNFRSIAAPRMQGPDAGRALVLTYVAPSGKIVHKGELVAELDPQALRDHVDDIQAQIDQTEANIRKHRAEQALSFENLQQRIRVAKAAGDKARLDASAAEIRTPIDAELVKLNVEEAEATYKEQLTDLATWKASDTADMRFMELDRELQVRHRDRHKNDILAFSIHAPITGLVVMQSIRRAGEMAQVALGDQVAPAQPFMKIVDTNSMQVEAAVSQVASEEMRLGQPAQVGFDAFPDLKLNAKVINIGAIATPGLRTNAFLRNVPVFLSILDPDNRIIPDLSTSSDVIVNRAENAPLVPRAAVESRDGKSFVRVKRGAGYETRQVKLGLGDNIHIAVLEGVQAGDEVALDHPVEAASEPAGN
jgi:multidrug efflux pump subunit AcrA (membrane-fusion protein)